MNKFFDIVVENPELVDEYAGSHNHDGPNFTEMFSHLFPRSMIYSESVKSYLTVVSDHFSLSPAIRIHPRTKDSVRNLFYYVGLDPDDQDNIPSCIFWEYLTKMYWIHNRRYRSDQIFAFMNDFALNEVRVVILANDPSPKYLSSGRAFHLSKCDSTMWILNLLNREMHLIENARRFRNQNSTRLTLDDRELEIAEQNCSLQGWINQRVLLLNSNLTRESDKWSAFTDFLIHHLSATRSKLVFMLLGRGAYLDKLHLIDQKKHLVLCVRHPCSYSFENSRRGELQLRDWEVQLPFINANLFLYQTAPNSLIDWSDVDGNRQAGSAARLTEVFNFCRDLCCTPNAMPFYDDNGWPIYELEHLRSGEVAVKNQSIYR